MRNFIFRNGTAYDINLTIASLVALPRHDYVQECINAMVEYQFRGDGPDFLPDVQDTSRPLLILFSNWLHLFGVEVDPDASVSLDDGSNSLSGGSIEALDGVPVITEEEERRIGDAATQLREIMRIRNASPDDVMHFPGIEYNFAFDLDDEETMEQDD